MRGAETVSSSWNIPPRWLCIERFSRRWTDRECGKAPLMDLVYIHGLLSPVRSTAHEQWSSKLQNRCLPSFGLNLEIHLKRRATLRLADQLARPANRSKFQVVRPGPPIPNTPFSANRSKL